MELARQGRQTVAAVKAAEGFGPGQQSSTPGGSGEEEHAGSYVVAPPPGTGEVEYASLAGD